MEFCRVSDLFFHIPARAFHLQHLGVHTSQTKVLVMTFLGLPHCELSWLPLLSSMEFSATDIAL